MTNAVKSELSAVDEDSTFERALTKYVNEPSVRAIPAWVKPNTISAINHLCVWSSLVLAYLSVVFDESQHEHQLGKMDPGRSLQSARFAALICRLLQATLVFISMVFDCLDGMHARRTGQCSRLGEVMDHALDAANIPLLSAGAVITWSVDHYSRALAMLLGGFVFNAQLVVYKHKKRMVKPPANGPESQMTLIFFQYLLSFVFYFVGRWAEPMHYVMVIVAIIANVIQFTNAVYFWRHLELSFAVDHLRFAALTIAYGAIFMAGLMSDIVFEIGSIFIAFRLSGSYVLFTVANKHKAAQEEGGTKTRPLDSSFGSMYSGIDFTVLAFVVTMFLVQYSVADPALALKRHSIYGLTVGLLQMCTMSELAVLGVFGLIMAYVNALDLRKCLPYLVPSAVHKSLVSLFI